MKYNNNNNILIYNVPDSIDSEVHKEVLLLFLCIMARRLEEHQACKKS